MVLCKILLIIPGLLLLLSSCNHTPNWKLRSKDCYEQVKSNFLKDRIYYREIEAVLPLYLDSPFYCKHNNITLENIDSCIPNAALTASLRRFFKGTNINTVSFDDNSVSFWYAQDNCISEEHTDSYPAVYQSLSFVYRTDTLGVSNFKSETFGRFINYSISYRLSDRWYYNNVVQRGNTI